MSRPDWVAVDWGTTCLRAWGLSASGTVLWSDTSDKGMGALTRDGFEPALLDLIGSRIGGGVTPVVACGMVGSRQGWIEASYATVPAKPLGADLARAPTRDARLSVHVIPGLSQSKPADVMRGEETQIAGFLALNPGFDGVICLPGTHTKWAHISAGEVVSFQTAMTGELYAALTQHTVLKHSTQGDGWDAAAFTDAISETLSRPERLAGYLFGIRAANLLSGTENAVSRARLSGLLIGAELAATRPFWLGQAVAIVGADALSRAYAAALETQGVLATQATADRMTLAGLAAAYAALKEMTP